MRRGSADPRGDDELLRETRAGAGSFDVFYVRHREVVLAFLARRVREPELAADLLAETFAAALLAVHDRERDLPDVPLAWLFAIARRKLIDSHRRGSVESEARRRLALEPLELDDRDIDRIIEIGETIEPLVILAGKLPPEQLEALRARVIEERPYAEIARELRCSQAVVRKRVSRALNTLRSATEAGHD